MTGETFKELTKTVWLSDCSHKMGRKWLSASSGSKSISTSLSLSGLVSPTLWPSSLSAVWTFGGGSSVCTDCMTQRFCLANHTQHPSEDAACTFCLGGYQDEVVRKSSLRFTLSAGCEQPCSFPGQSQTVVAWIFLYLFTGTGGKKAQCRQGKMKRSHILVL